MRTMTMYDHIFSEALESLHREGRYRIFADLRREVGSFPLAEFHRDGKVKEVTVWCSNDYLGMGQHPMVLSAMQDALRTYGCGSGGTRNISGTHHAIIELEKELSDLHDKEAALVFTSGFVANDTSLCTLARLLPDCIVLSDAMNHSSMIEGIRHSRAEKLIFEHSSTESLRALLQRIPRDRPKIIAFESVYSMEGDIAPIEEFCDLADEFNAITYVDETHAVGLYGHKGGGLVQAHGLTDRVTVLQGGLGKAFGVIGGFITSTKEIIDCVRSYGSGFIFTTSLPPVVAMGAKTSVNYLKTSSKEREMMKERVLKMKSALIKANLPLMHTESHIIPVLVGDSTLCKRVTDILLNEYQIYVQPINYPTVPRGTERLRITPTPCHTDKMIEDLVEALDEIWNRLNLSRGEKSIVSSEVVAAAANMSA